RFINAKQNNISDNAESVTELIKTESQQIQLIVNEQDKKLRMETI
ncbi:hypothetical protein U35_01010, partial [Staphylococcus aureus M0676]